MSTDGPFVNSTNILREALYKTLTMTTDKALPKNSAQ